MQIVADSEKAKLTAAPVLRFRKDFCIQVVSWLGTSASFATGAFLGLEM